MALVECKHCGNEISDRATVCPRCGKSVIASPSIVCEECGTTYEVDKATCPQCGCPTPEASDKSTRLANPAHPKNTKKIVAIAVVVLLAIALIGGFAARQIQLQKKYERASQLLDNENRYEYAVQVFTELGNYKDSKDKVTYLNEQLRLKNIYDQALPMLEDETQLDDALAVFIELGDFKDSKEKVTYLNGQIQLRDEYNQATSLLNEKNFNEALPAFEALGDYKDSTKIANALSAENYFYFLNVGDTYSFGTYEQDNDLSNGTEIIKWLILAKEENKALLISCDLLDSMGFHKWTGETWDHSSVRQWLNGTFYDTAFSSDEQKQIILTNVSNPPNPVFGTLSGEDTEDNIFLLSIEEYETYFKEDIPKAAKRTPFAEAERQRRATWDKEYSANPLWWLRTSACEYKRHIYVTAEGRVINQENNFGCDMNLGIRPAMWVSFES